MLCVAAVSVAPSSTTCATSPARRRGFARRKRTSPFQKPAPQSRARAAMGRDRWKPIERDLRQTAGALIAGVDEVGRGPLAGPVVACACIMPPGERANRGVDDSKQLTAGEREKLFVRIRERAVCVSVAAASVREIDRLNIYHAT